MGIDWSPFKEACDGAQHPHSFRSQGEAPGSSRDVQLYLLSPNMIPPQLPTARLPSCPTAQIASMTWVKGTFLASEDWSLQFPLMMTQSSHPPTPSSSLSCLLFPSIVIYGRRPEQIGRRQGHERASHPTFPTMSSLSFGSGESPMTQSLGDSGLLTPTPNTSSNSEAQGLGPCTK